MIEEDMIIEMWDVFKEYIPEKNREIAASHYVDFLLGRDVGLSVLGNVTGYDPHMDSAINLALKEDGDYEDEEEDEDNWDSGEEEEDY
jgi:hypothetical protein